MSSPRSVGELAELVGGVCHGDPDILIHGVADLHGAGPEEIRTGIVTGKQIGRAHV